MEVRGAVLMDDEAQGLFGLGGLPARGLRGALEMTLGAVFVKLHGWSFPAV